MATSYNQKLMVKLFIEEDKLAHDEKRKPSTRKVQNRFRLEMKPKLNEEQIVKLLETTYARRIRKKIKLTSIDAILNDIIKSVMESYNYNFETAGHLVWWCLKRQPPEATKNLATLIETIESVGKNFKKFEDWTFAHIEQFGRLPINTNELTVPTRLDTRA